MAHRLALILALLVAAPVSAQDREIEAGAGMWFLDPLGVLDFKQESTPTANAAWTNWYGERSGWTVGVQVLSSLGGGTEAALFGHVTWRRRWLHGGEGNFTHLGVGAGPTVLALPVPLRDVRTILGLFVPVACGGAHHAPHPGRAGAARRRHLHASPAHTDHRAARRDGRLVALKTRAYGMLRLNHPPVALLDAPTRLPAGRARALRVRFTPLAEPRAPVDLQCVADVAQRIPRSRKLVYKLGANPTRTTVPVAVTDFLETRR